MITQQDLDYHLKREREQRTRAELATDPSVRRSHLDLAKSHARRAENAKEFLKRQNEPEALRESMAERLRKAVTS